MNAQTANPTLNEAIALHCKGKVTEAITKYQQVARESENNSEVRHARFANAACLFSMKAYDAAVSGFEQFARDFPDDAQAPLALVHAGNCFSEQGRFDAAEPYYRQVLAMQQPDENMRIWIGWAHLGMGKVLHHRDEYETALVYLQQAILQAPETKVSNEAKRLLIECLDALKQAGEEGTAAEWIGRSYFALARLHQDEGRYQEAAECLLYTLASTTEGNLLADGYVREAECLFVLGRTQEALTAAQAVELIQDRDQTFLAKRDDWIVRAMCWGVRALLRDGRALQAADLADQVLSDHGYTDQGPVRELKLLKANALVNAGQVEQAIDIPRDLHAESISDEWNALTDELPGDYYLQVSRYPEAIQAYLGIIGSNSGVAEIEAGSRYKLAFCYWRTGNVQAAREYLSQISERYPATSWKDPAQRSLKNWFKSRAADGQGGEPR